MEQLRNVDDQFAIRKRSEIPADEILSPYTGYVYELAGSLREERRHHVYYMFEDFSILTREQGC